MIRPRPWPTYPLLLRISAAHEEGGERVFGVNSTSIEGTDGKVTGLHMVEGKRIPGGFIPTEGTETHFDADLILIALGFVGPEKAGPARRSRCADLRPRHHRAGRELHDQRARRVRRR